MNTPRTTRSRRVAAVVAAGALGLGLAACSDDQGETITLGYLPDWTDGLATAYLLDHVLTEAGYTVEHQELNDPGILYASLADGDVDMYPSAWPEVTHANYMDDFGDTIEDIGTYYEGAVLTLAVPEYSQITSMDEILDFADELDNRIVGIEAGAGLTGTTQDSAFPAYGWDEAGFELQTSSTMAMLGELEAAMSNEEEIVVTLWRPFWANAEYGVRDLEDPEGAMGDPEGLHFLGRDGFAADLPEVAEWIESLYLDDEQFGELEDLVTNEYEDDPAAGVEAFMENNADVVGSPGE